MPAIQTWQPTDSIASIVQCLKDGGCVALPTESTYEVAASARRGDAVARLQALAREDVGAAVVLVAEAELRDWLPGVRGVGPRLFRKLGPGPLVLQAGSGYSDGLAARLPEATQRILVAENLLSVRWPDHAVWQGLREMGEPLISLSLPAQTAQQAAALLGDQVEWIVDGGPTEFGGLPSVVRLTDRWYELRRKGVLDDEQIRELALCRILFICTGNTCRSPMAEVLCAKLLAEKLGCGVAELAQHGFCVQSAGLAAMTGQQASPEAVTVVAQAGAELSPHRSRMATMQMLACADHIFTMTAGHRQALLQVPGIPPPRLLSCQDEDVVDPIGGELADYQACAQQIQACLHQRLPELLAS